MEFGTLIDNLAKDPVFIAVYGLLLLSFINFATGTARAGLGGYFDLGKWRAWVDKDSPTILPIIILLLGAKAVSVVHIISVGGIDISAGTVLGAYALSQAVTVIASFIDSIKENVSPNPTAKAAKAAKAATAGDPLPETR